MVIQIYDLETHKLNKRMLISCEGAILKLCGALFVDELPESFASEKNSWVNLMTFKRAEKPFG